MADQASRWRAFVALERSDSTNIVLADETGQRYVRVGWFGQYVRAVAGPSLPDAVLRAMPSLGWSRRGRGRAHQSHPAWLQGHTELAVLRRPTGVGGDMSPVTGNRRYTSAACVRARAARTRMEGGTCGYLDGLPSIPR